MKRNLMSHIIKYIQIKNKGIYFLKYKIEIFQILKSLIKI